MCVIIGVNEQLHRRDSIQGIDYIANPFFMNLKVSIQNLRWQFSGDIIQVTFRKSVTSLVPKNVNKLISNQYFVAQLLRTHFFLSFWTNDFTNFLKVMNLMSSPNCHLRFSIVFLKTLKFQWQCSQYLELNPTCELVTMKQIRIHEFGKLTVPGCQSGAIIQWYMCTME